MKLREEVLQDDIEVIFHYQDDDFDEMVDDKRVKKEKSGQGSQPLAALPALQRTLSRIGSAVVATTIVVWKRS